MMCSTTILVAAAATLISLVSAKTYSISVFAPGTTVDGALLNAAGQSFYTGTSGPATYCPTVVHDCPQVEGTLVYQGLTAMAVEVPGGQQIYVSPSGLLKYTMAHSAYMPTGSLVGGFYTKTVVQECGPQTTCLDYLAPDGSNMAGLALCPDIPDYMSNTGASYALYARVSGFNLTDCVDILGLHTVESDVSYGAWQYL